jgi:hypothetical protein
MRLVSVSGLVLVVAAAFGSGCGGGGESTVAAGGLPQGSEQSHVAPAEFTVAIDNPYWPARPGNRWIYREIEAGGTVKRDVVTVTGRTKMIADGVEARVVHDVATEHGRPAEVTDDWYAQDSAGNVWYLGEQTTEYENGRAVSSEGSWEAGVDGAQPGVIMPARPRTGQAYRQEFYAGEAEDSARVLSTEEQVQVPFGHFGSAVLTKETSPLEPRVVEYKLYAPNVGEAMAMDVSGESDREELISFTRR